MINVWRSTWLMKSYRSWQYSDAVPRVYRNLPRNWGWPEDDHKFSCLRQLPSPLFPHLSQNVLHLFWRTSSIRQPADCLTILTQCTPPHEVTKSKKMVREPLIGTWWDVMSRNESWSGTQTYSRYAQSCVSVCIEHGNVPVYWLSTNPGEIGWFRCVQLCLQGTRLAHGHRFTEMMCLRHSGHQTTNPVSIKSTMQLHGKTMVIYIYINYGTLTHATWNNINWNIFCGSMMFPRRMTSMIALSRASFGNGKRCLAASGLATEDATPCTGQYW